MKLQTYLNIVKLLPNKIIYTCYIHVLAYATSGEYGTNNLDEMTPLLALKIWAKDNGVD